MKQIVFPTTGDLGMKPSVLRKLLVLVLWIGAAVVWMRNPDTVWWVFLLSILVWLGEIMIPWMLADFPLHLKGGTVHMRHSVFKRLWIIIIATRRRRKARMP